jgi:chromatin structure-remodeling complex subunit RSC4
MAPKRKSGAVSSAAKRPKVEAVSLKDFISSVLSLVNELKDPSEERVLVAPFIKLPPKKVYPDYYEIIKEPISVSDIQKKEAKDKYPDTASFLDDFKLLMENAKTYNDPDSWIAVDAKQIYDFVKDQVDLYNSVAEEKPSKSKTKLVKVKREVVSKPVDEDELVTSANLTHLCIDLLYKVIEHEFPDVGIISGPFMDNIDRREYPEYFQVIKTPTSFNNVLKKLDKRKIFTSKTPLDESLQAFYDATKLIFTNAQTFNDPSSLIHQDAVKLSDYFEELFQALKARVEQQEQKTKLKLKLKSPGQGKVKLNLKLKEDEPDEPQVTESDTMGKTSSRLSPNEMFIQLFSFATSNSSVTQMNNTSHVPTMSKAQISKASLFPTHPASASNSIVEYQYPSTGFATQSYCISLPPDGFTFYTFKVCLHKLLYDIKRKDLESGLGLLTSDDDFQCKLFVNDDEVHSGMDVYEDYRNKSKLLSYQYDLRLCNGLNVITFECKVAPAVSKQIKGNRVKNESDETAGRHTRNQLQQAKMSWDVERINFNVICNST